MYWKALCPISLTAPLTRSQTQFLNHSLSTWFLLHRQLLCTFTAVALTSYSLIFRDPVPALNGTRDGDASVADHVCQRGLEAVAFLLREASDLGGYSCIE